MESMSLFEIIYSIPIIFIVTIASFIAGTFILLLMIQALYYFFGEKPKQKASAAEIKKLFRDPDFALDGSGTKGYINGIKVFDSGCIIKGK